MTTPEKPDLDALMFKALADVIAAHDPGCIPIKFVGAMEVMDRDGERALWTVAGPDVRAWETTGMLQHALHIQAGETMARTWHALVEEDGEEDG